MMAAPSAPPSAGAVPAPTSSSKTSDGNPRWRSIATILAMCPENVDRLVVIDWSSPMSAKMLRQTGTDASGPAGMWRPAWAIATRRPAVLRATVFPPVLGPVKIRVLIGGLRWMSTGTGSEMPSASGAASKRARTALMSRGWRAFGSSRWGSVVSRGSLPAIRREKLARAWITSSSVAASSV